METTVSNISALRDCGYAEPCSSNDTVGYDEMSDEYVSTEEEFSCEEIEEIRDCTVERLSSFADKITRDLDRFIRFNSTAEDHCDVYEDKFAATISGRDLYYADLLAMARYGDSAESYQAMTRKRDKRVECKWPCSGRRNPKLGLGPLSQLFDHLYKPPGVLRHGSGIADELQFFNEKNTCRSDFNYSYLESNLMDQLDLSEILEKWPLENTHHGEPYAPHNSFITRH